jgi:hypothetical protein
MTVKQLIAELQKLDPNRIVVLQKDAEGNGYSPLVGAEHTIYRPESTWSGQCYPDDPAKHEEYEYTKERGDKKAVVLWPTN